MTKPCLIISTIGTSLLTNGADENQRMRLRDTANFLKGALNAVDQSLIDQRQKHAMGVLAQGLSHAKKESAELNGIIAWYGGSIPKDCRDLHYLVHTDTAQGGVAAEVVRNWLNNNGLQCQVELISGLRVDDPKRINQPLAILAHWVAKLTKGYRDSHRVVFHLSGGFKSITGFMQVAGMLYADEIVYIFDQGYLMRIPRLPLALDQGVHDVLSQYSNFFRRLMIHEILNVNEIPEEPTLQLFIERECDFASLSPWGVLCCEQWRQVCYKKEVLLPPSARIEFGHGFSRSCKDLAPVRIEAINNRIDQLDAFLASKGMNNPTSLDYKQIKGGAAQGSTHEADAWSDGDARRLYMHKEGDVLIIDRLGAHL